MLFKAACLWLFTAFALSALGCGKAVELFLRYQPEQSASSSSAASYPSLWSEYSGNPLFGGNVDGVNRAYYPAVVKAGSIYHVWYGNGQMTLHCASVYADFHDVVHPGTIVTVDGVGITNFFSTNVYHPVVDYSATGWTVNGTNYSEVFIMYATPGFNRVSVMVSSNGSNWSSLGDCTGIMSSPNQGVNVYTFEILQESVTDWKAYADNGGGEIQYYTSTNGFNWTNQGTNILGSEYQWWENPTNYRNIAPRVVKDNGIYHLYFSGGTNNNNKGIGLAISSNGYEFSKATNNPIFWVHDGPAWRNDRTYTPWIIRDGSLWRMYFSGRSTAGGVYSVGMASNLGPLD